MKNNMLLIFITLTILSCTETPNNEENKKIAPLQYESGVLEQSDSIFEYLTDGDLNHIKISRSKWFDSWNWDISNLKMGDFKVNWKKEMNFDWLKYDPYDKYLMKYDTLLIYSANKLALDLYSYNTVIEIEGTNIFVGFDVDSKIYAADKEKKIRAEIVHGGSYEIIEEGCWLDNKRVVLLGYTTEEKNIPFLWVIDITTKKQIAYSYKASFNQQRSNYFLVKYPKTKLRTG